MRRSYSLMGAAVLAMAASAVALPEPYTREEREDIERTFEKREARKAANAAFAAKAKAEAEERRSRRRAKRRKEPPPVVLSPENGEA